jgi:hypothetical protein
VLRLKKPIIFLGRFSKCRGEGRNLDGPGYAFIFRRKLRQTPAYRPRIPFVLIQERQVAECCSSSDWKTFQFLPQRRANFCNDLQGVGFGSTNFQRASRQWSMDNGQLTVTDCQSVATTSPRIINRAHCIGGCARISNRRNPARRDFQQATAGGGICVAEERGRRKQVGGGRRVRGWGGWTCRFRHRRAMRPAQGV